MVPKGKPGLTDGREESVTVTGMEGATGMYTRIGMGTGAGAGAGVGTRMERRVEGRESLGWYEVTVEMGRKTRERG